jgi:hypothetical protein
VDKPDSIYIKIDDDIVSQISFIFKARIWYRQRAKEHRYLSTITPSQLSLSVSLRTQSTLPSLQTSLITQRFYGCIIV